MSLDAILYIGDDQVRLHGAGTDDDECVYVDRDGIEGWLSAPEVKTEPVERKWGNGAHDVAVGDISYAARTVTLHLDLVSNARERLLGMASLLSRAAGHLVRLRVVDGGQDMYVEGYVRPEYGATWSDQVLTGTLTMVCPRPERLSWSVRRDQVWPGGGMSGGLSYGSPAAGLAYPLSYGVLPESRDTLLLRNQGSATAYPLLTLDGDHRGRLLLVWDGRSLEWSGGVGGPVVFDCRTQTASMGGVDQSRGLVSRAFPAVPPGGSVLVRLVEAGDGWLTVESRDTYI